jgi:hypothetical protein
LYRLHFSTFTVVLLPLTALILIIVPGHPARGWHGSVFSNVQVTEFEHGWPFVHLDRVVAKAFPPGSSSAADLAGAADSYVRVRDEWPLVEESGRWLRLASTPAYHVGLEMFPEPCWWAPSNWQHHGHRLFVHGVALALNLATALVICGVVAGLHEWWRRRRQRFCQFHLRDLLLLVLIVAAALGYWRTLLTETSRESKLVRSLERDGFLMDIRCHAPVWLCRLIGVERLHWFYRVESVTGPYESHADSSSSGKIDGDEVSASSDPIENLRDAAEGFAHLRQICLIDPDDAALEELAGLAGFPSLSLCNPGVSDEGWRLLEGFPDLEELEIVRYDRGRLGDAVLTHLRRLSGLRTLRLQQLSFQDVPLARLAELPALECLSLSHSDLSDDQLVHLAKLKSLRELSILDTDVTDAAARQLKRTLPNTVIRHSTGGF